MSSTLLPNAKCFCLNVDFGTYAHTVVMQMPDKRLVTIDICIAATIAELWHQGIRTLNSCCGHQKREPSVIIDEADYNKVDGGYDLAPSGLREYYLNSNMKILNSESEGK